MRICDDLRRTVLQAAIQGKLTKQMPEDGNASDLLKKNLSLIENDENLFDIPLSWKWVKLGDIGSFTRGSGIKRNEVTSDGYPCIRYGQLYTTYHNIISEVQSKTSETVFNKSKKIKHGDLVMALTGENNYDIALACAYTGNEIVAIGGDMTAFTHNVNPLYLVIAINSPYGIKCKSKLATGNIIVHISNDKLASIPFPLPPLAEQKRIVARVEELMARIDDLEKTETELEKLKATFPGDMKAALLQAAMQGKLTEQLPEDGDAADLLEQIVKEKSQLIKEGKIKKEKPLPEITPDEVPFDVPENWKWVRLTDILSVYGGKRIPLGYKLTDINTGHKYITVGDMKNGTVLTDRIKYVPEKVFDSIKRYTVSTKDVYITVAGTIGRVGEIPNELDGANLTENADKLVFGNQINKYWLIRALQSSIIQKQISDATTKVGQPKLAIKRIESFILPLPPLAEQKRIVEKLDKLLPLCDGLIEE